jgi:toxin ParE1/3/4
MRRLEFTPRARRDIQDIWEYSAQRFGDERAEAHIQEIERAAQTIAEDPRRGRPCDEVRQDYRKFSVGSHVLFFREARRAVVIVRVLHQRMDFEPRLR